MSDTHANRMRRVHESREELLQPTINHTAPLIRTWQSSISLNRPAVCLSCAVLCLPTVSHRLLISIGRTDPRPVPCHCRSQQHFAGTTEAHDARRENWWYGKCFFTVTVMRAHPLHDADRSRCGDRPGRKGPCSWRNRHAGGRRRSRIPNETVGQLFAARRRPTTLGRENALAEEVAGTQDVASAFAFNPITTIHRVCDACAFDSSREDRGEFDHG